VEPKLYISFSLDSAVPSNHLVRRLAAAVDLDFIRSLVKNTYSHTGQPSVDPVVIFKLSLLGYLYGIRSERRVCEEAGLNMAWRWFLGYELDEPVPDHSVLSKARRRFGRAVYERFFTRIVQLCEARGLVEGDVVFLDSTLSKANASPKSLRSRALVDQRTLTKPKEFVAQLWEANPEAEREDAAPRPRQGPGRPRKDKPARRAVVNGMLVSATDPDAEVATKLGQPRLLAHKTHMVVDGGKARIITAVEVRPATEGDAQAVVDMLTRHRLKLGRQPRELVADAGYASDATWNACLTAGVQPTIAMRPVLNRTGGLNPSRFTYVPERDLYICPEGKELGHKTLAFEKRRVVYRPKRGTCQDCPLKAQCAPGRGDRSITRRWEMEQYEAMKRHLRNRRSQRLLRRRKAVSELVFAHAKEQHGFGRAQFRGRAKMQIQALLTASVMNLKQLVRRRPEAQSGRAIVIGQKPILDSHRPLARLWRGPIRTRALGRVRRVGPPSL
ncbi:MAG: IS1182 family transposase, partial [Candidatus Dormiibacterota bacterium]